MDLAALQKEAHSIAKEKGSWDQEPTFGEVISDLHEALSGIRAAHRVADDALPYFVWRKATGGWQGDTRDLARWAIEQGYEKRPAGVPSAMAEVVIRAANIAEHHRWDLDSLSVSIKQLFLQEPSRLHGLDIFGYWLAKCHEELSMAFSMMEHFESNNDRGDLTMTAGWVIAKFIAMIETMAAHHEIDLEYAIQVQLAYKRTRPHWSG